MIDRPIQSPEILMNNTDIERVLLRMSHEILEQKDHLNDLAFVGIKTRGEYLAHRFVSLVKGMGVRADFGTLDITLYRDDFDTLGDLTVGETDLLFDVAGKRIILVDDVLHSGRTIRAALDQIIDFGRPAKIELACLVDRGGRELPITANYVGQTYQISSDEYIQVRLSEVDGEDQVIGFSKDHRGAKGHKYFSHSRKDLNN